MGLEKFHPKAATLAYGFYFRLQVLGKQQQEGPSELFTEGFYAPHEKQAHPHWEEKMEVLAEIGRSHPNEPAPTD